MTHKSCIFWPDAMPRPAFDVTGKKWGRLKYITPIYCRNRTWFYLAICSCGTETIVTRYQAKSCGCLRLAGHREIPEVAYNYSAPNDHKLSTIKAAEFDRLKICTRLPFICKHYVACQEARLSSGAFASSRYTALNGNCYEMTKEERSFKTYDPTPT